MKSTLTFTILSKQNIETLYQWYLKTPLIDIEKEIVNRLLSSDFVEQKNIINFLYQTQYQPWLKSVYIKQGLKQLITSLPWKIGVIYDYRDQSYKINNISAIVGFEKILKTNKGIRFKPTWLESEKTGLVLREIVSKNSKPYNKVISVVTSDTKLDQYIRSLLINNQQAIVTVCDFEAPVGTTFHSYPSQRYLSKPEFKQTFPCHIEMDGYSHDLINLVGINQKRYRINIIKTPEVVKLLSLV